jgi:chemotaxis protein CheD
MPDILPTNEQPAMIGIGEYKVGSFPMMSIGLGSCVGLIFYDTDKHIGAMVHIMLPDSSGRKDRPGKYADTAFPLLLQELAALGSRKQSIVAKIAGGASMFQYFGNNLNIGERNIERIKALLEEHHIRLVAEDVGGKVGRSVTFLPGNGGKVTVRRADGECKEI